MSRRLEFKLKGRLSVMSKKIYFILVLVIVGAGYYGYKKYYGRNPAAQGPAGAMGMMGGPMPVTVAMPVTQDVESYYEFTGNTAAVEQVDIRARVAGVLQEIHFADGAEVNRGQLLFIIEPNSYTARQDQAEAQLKAAQADLERAQQDYDRMEKAIQNNAVSKQDVTTKKAQRDQAQAMVMAAQADLQNADLNVGYTQVASPIAGRVSRRLVDVGNLVGAGEQTLLATVVRTQPMYVYFNVSEDLLHSYFLKNYSGDAIRQQKIQVGFADGQNYPYEGMLDYIDNKVDPMTGTISVRGQVANADKQLLPGMFVQVRVPTGVKKDAILIEEKAVQSDLGGKYVLTVDAQNIAQYHRIQLGRKLDGKVAVESGLDKTDRYIVGGFHFARPGAPVVPQMAGAPGPAGLGGPAGAGAGAKQENK
jgi:RND family efflux transporter MFP subunit